MIHLLGFVAVAFRVFFPNKVIFEILRARSLATGFGDTNTAINIALDHLICNGNSQVICLSRSPDHVNCSVLCLVEGHFVSDIFIETVNC